MSIHATGHSYEVKLIKGAYLATKGMLWWKRKELRYTILETWKQDYQDDPTNGNSAYVKEFTRGHCQVYFSTVDKDERDKIYKELVEDK